MPLSTSRPKEITNENNMIILMGILITDRITKEIANDNGIDNPTKRAFQTPKKNKRTNTTKIIPEIMLFSNVFTCSFVF